MKSVLMPHPESNSDFVEAKDYYYIDNEGRKYIDLESGIWCASLGHSHPKIVETLQKQAVRFIHSGTKLKPELINNVAEKLLLKANMQGKVFFMNTGSEAIDFALTIAKLSNEKAEITGFTDNYLGAYGQVSSIQNKIDIKKCLSCSVKTCNKECRIIRDKIKPHGILIFDPFCFARQVFEIPLKLVEHLKSEIKKKKVTLILDEITAGLGRTGKWFGYQQYDLKPDIVVLGKTLGNGYPVSAVLIDKNIVKLVENKSFTYAQSHQNDPLGCTIAGAVIDTLERERLIEASEKNGQKLLDMLRAELSELKEVVDIRGKGLMLAVELSKNICVTLVYQRLIEKGLIIGISTHYNVLNIFPAYTLPKEKFATIIEKMKESIKEEASSLAEISALKLKSLSFKY
jgi:acetylornithine/N-succinyldiaminopimelate aminotransferase